MADIAFIFHWQLSELEAMTIADLALWHAKARARLEAVRGKHAPIPGLG